MSEHSNERDAFPRRTFLKLSAAGTAAIAVATTSSRVVPDLRRKGLLSTDGLFDAASIAWADKIYTETYPTSPLILSPFNDELIIPKAMAPEYLLEYSSWKRPPGSR